LKYIDESFTPAEGLERAVKLLKQRNFEASVLPRDLSAEGLGEEKTLDLLAFHVLGRAAALDHPLTFAHMDPPTPWITWATSLWNSRLNQNLLHPSISPFASEAETKVMSWITPFFGMNGGHMCSGSTVANLTALWAARDVRKVTKIVASEYAHLSIQKSAQILGLPFECIKTDEGGRIDRRSLGDMTDAALVLTAGTTAAGTIDPLDLVGHAGWSHIDAAWSGPLRMTQEYSHLLDGIEMADSVVVSAHKWFYQPKDSALIMFRNPQDCDHTLSLSSDYLAKPNTGLQGSRGAAAIPLLATLLAWGSNGIAERICRSMRHAKSFAGKIDEDDRLILWAEPKTGIVLFRPKFLSVDDFQQRLPENMFSTCKVDGQDWLRAVAVNPILDVEGVILEINKALS
jgi:glutamate/tyrosine decarboxylase-like PLP-dependent enzyme